jgi:hypothetical protein
MTETIEETPFQKWYRVHKDEYAAKRRERYAKDPAYRARAIAQSLKYNNAKKAATVTLTPKYCYSLPETAKKLGIHPSVLRRWRKKEYYPEPHTTGGRAYFSLAQCNFLISLRMFFAEHGVHNRMTLPDKEKLASIISLISVNWD